MPAPYHPCFTTVTVACYHCLQLCLPHHMVITEIFFFLNTRTDQGSPPLKKYVLENLDLIPRTEFSWLEHRKQAFHDPAPAVPIFLVVFHLASEVGASKLLAVYLALLAFSHSLSLLRLTLFQEWFPQD